MAEVDAQVMKNVRAFLAKLRLTGIHVTKAYFFGSYSKGLADRFQVIKNNKRLIQNTCST